MTMPSLDSGGIRYAMPGRTSPRPSRECCLVTGMTHGLTLRLNLISLKGLDFLPELHKVSKGWYTDDHTRKQRCSQNGMFECSKWSLLLLPMLNIRVYVGALLLLLYKVPAHAIARGADRNS